MIERFYKCNLCRDQYSPADLIGLYWSQDGWIQKYATECENHICSRCAESIYQIYIRQQHATAGEEE